MRFRLLGLACLLVAPLAFAPAASARHAVRPFHATIRADTLPALLARAKAAFVAGDDPTAEALFAQAAALDPRSAVAWAGKARSEARMGDDVHAVVDYTSAIRYAPRNPGYRLRRGLSYDTLEEVPQALADYTMAIQLAPGYADVYFDRGSLYYNHEQYTPSLADYTRAIALRPTWWLAYYYRGENENPLHLFQAAIGDATTYIQHTPGAECDCAYILRGNAYYSLHQYAKALADYQQAIAIGQPGNAEYFDCGTAAYHLSLNALAISCFTRAIAFSPGNGQAYHYRGLARWDSGDRRGAIADLKMAVQLYTQQGDVGTAQAITVVLRQLQGTA